MKMEVSLGDVSWVVVLMKMGMKMEVSLGDV